jgi:hypothetical protein
MPLYAYARESSVDQDLAIRTVSDPGREEERHRGQGRSEQLLLDFLHKGDPLVVTCIDRLACSATALDASYPFAHSSESTQGLSLAGCVSPRLARLAFELPWSQP